MAAETRHEILSTGEIVHLLTRRRWIVTGAALTAALAAGGAALLSGSAGATSTSSAGRAMGAVVQSAPQRAGPAGDQGPVGSCVSWTVGYTMSGWYAKKNGLLGVPYVPLFLYSQLVNGHGGPNVGTTFGPT